MNLNKEIKFSNKNNFVNNKNNKLSGEKLKNKNNKNNKNRLNNLKNKENNLKNKENNLKNKEENINLFLEEGIRNYKSKDYNNAISNLESFLEKTDKNNQYYEKISEIVRNSKNKELNQLLNSNNSRIKKSKNLFEDSETLNIIRKNNNSYIKNNSELNKLLEQEISDSEEDVSDSDIELSDSDIELSDSEDELYSDDIKLLNNESDLNEYQMDSNINNEINKYAKYLNSKQNNSNLEDNILDNIKTLNNNNKIIKTNAVFNDSNLTNAVNNSVLINQENEIINTVNKQENDENEEDYEPNYDSLNFKLIEGFYDEKKLLIDSIVYPIIFKKLYNKNNNILLTGYDCNCKYNLIRACYNELKNLDINEDIHFMNKNISEFINCNNSTFKKEDNYIIYIHESNKNYYIDNNLLCNKLKELCTMNNIIIIYSIDNIKNIESELDNMENELDKIFNLIINIKLPDYYERVDILISQLYKRYIENYPDKVCNLYLDYNNLEKEDNYYIYRKIFKNKDGVDLLKLFPLIKKINIPSGKKLNQLDESDNLDEHTETIEEYKERLNNNIKFMIYVDLDKYIELIYKINLIIEKDLDSYKININLYDYIKKYTKNSLSKILQASSKNYSKVQFDKDNDTFINHMEICIFIHYLSDLLGPNQIIYNANIENNRRYCDKSISSYGYTSCDLKEIINKVISHLAKDIITSHVKHVPLNKCIISSNSCGESKEYNKCFSIEDNYEYSESSILDLEKRNNLHNNDTLFIVSQNKKIYDSYCYLKFNYFIHAINSYKSNIANNDSLFN